MSSVTRGQGVDWPQSSINWVLLGIHQHWIDQPALEQDDMEILAIPEDFPAEERSDEPPLV